jgi:hypothetical protein
MTHDACRIVLSLRQLRSLSSGALAVAALTSVRAEGVSTNSCAYWRTRFGCVTGYHDEGLRTFSVQESSRLPFVENLRESQK